MTSSSKSKKQFGRLKVKTEYNDFGDRFIIVYFEKVPEFRVTRAVDSPEYIPQEIDYAKKRIEKRLKQVFNMLQNWLR